MNSRARCTVCKQYFPSSEAFFVNRMTKCCSSECFGTMMGKARASKREAAGVAAWGRKAHRDLAPKIPIEVRAQVHERDNSICRCCGQKRGTQCHHIQFRSQGGRDELSNLILLCNECHQTKAHGDQSRRYRELFRQYVWLRMVEGKAVFVADLEGCKEGRTRPLISHPAAVSPEISGTAQSALQTAS